MGGGKTFLALLLILYSSISGPNLNEELLIGSIDRGVFGFVFICIGYHVYSKKKYFNTVKFKVLILTLTVIYLCSEVYYFSAPPLDDPKSMTFDDSFYKYPLLELSKIAAIFSLSVLISKVGGLSSFFCYIGERTLQILVYHPLCIYLVNWWIKEYSFLFDKRLVLLVLSLLFSLLFSLFEQFVVSRVKNLSFE